jgi:hypothetical protein
MSVASIELGLEDRAYCLIDPRMIGMLIKEPRFLHYLSSVLHLLIQPGRPMIMCGLKNLQLGRPDNKADIVRSVITTLNRQK